MVFKEDFWGKGGLFAQFFQHTHTLTDIIYHIADFQKKHFNSFDILPIGIKKQMISHLKALVKSFENQE